MVSIIILSYNTKSLLLECLGSIYKYLKDFDMEVIVVDNASSDDSVTAVKKQFKKVKIIENKENYGFAKGNNIGAKKAKGDYILFLNSDTQFENNSIKNMIYILDSEAETAVVGGQLNNLDGSQQRSYGKFYNLLDVSIMLFGGEKTELVKNAIRKNVYVDWISGGFMLIRKEIFNRISGFDENFFMYIEDMEICYRIKKEGLKVKFCEEADVLHKGYASSNRTFAIVHIFKGLSYFYKKHKSNIEYKVILLLLRLKAYVSIVFGVLTQNRYLTKTYKEALLTV